METGGFMMKMCDLMGKSWDYILWQVNYIQFAVEAWPIEKEDLPIQNGGFQSTAMLNYQSVFFASHKPI